MPMEPAGNTLSEATDPKRYQRAYHLATDPDPYFNDTEALTNEGCPNSIFCS